MLVTFTIDDDGDIIPFGDVALTMPEHSPTGPGAMLAAAVESHSRVMWK